MAEQTGVRMLEGMCLLYVYSCMRTLGAGNLVFDDTTLAIAHSSCPAGYDDRFEGGYPRG